MDQTEAFRGKLSTINEMTESTGNPAFCQTLDEASETSINGMELDVTKRIMDRTVQIRQKLVENMIAPKLNKAIEKICKKFKVEKEEERGKLNAIGQELQQECHRLLQQRVDDIFNKNPDFQTMLSTICDLSVELTDSPEMVEIHLPIRKQALEKLTALSSTVIETVRNNSDCSIDLEQELKDQEQESNSKRKKLFRVRNLLVRA